MKFPITIFFSALWLCTLFISCTNQKVHQTSNDRLYKKDNNELAIKYSIYHINDSVSQLFYELSNEALVYKKTDTSDYFYAHLLIELNTSNENEISKVLYKESFDIFDKQTNVTAKTLKGSVYFKLFAPHNYFISINEFDVNKKNRYNTQLYAEKETTGSRQNFLILNDNNDVCIGSNYKANEHVMVYSLRYKETTYQIDYFKPNFRLALPPFSTNPMMRFSYKPDSSFKVKSSDGNFELTLPSSGFYHIKTNNDTKDGITLFVYEAIYPKIKNAEQMILATRYIMSKKEFDNCMNATDKKAAIDQFWLDLGGSNERAKELIKKYYGRVQEANRLFTSFQEGWKTDRGMMYIVFGAPTKVSTQKNGEIWYYGDVNNPTSLQFVFSKVINPFTSNDYLLERNDIYKGPWYQAEDMWRQGRIYLDN